MGTMAASLGANTAPCNILEEMTLVVVLQQKLQQEHHLENNDKHYSFYFTVMLLRVEDKNFLVAFHVL